MKMSMSPSATALRRQHAEVNTNVAPEQQRGGSDGTEIGLGWETK